MATRLGAVKAILSSVFVLVLSALLLLVPSASLASDPASKPFVVGSIGVGSGPLEVAITADGTRAYVANFTSDSVSVLNLATETLISTIAVGNEPTWIAISPLGGFAYVTNYDNGQVTSSLSRINLSTGVATTVCSGCFTGARSVVFSTDGSRAYVSSQNSNVISVIDTTNNIKLSDITVPAGPQNLAINGSRLYASHTVGNQLSFIDLSTTPATVSAPITGFSGPAGLALGGVNNSKLYVANQNANNVKVLNAITGAEITTITGLNSPESVTVNPSNTQVLVANQGANNVRIIDVATDTLDSSTVLTVGTTPFQVAFAPNGIKAYVPNLSSANVSIIEYFQVRTLAFATTSYTLSYGSTQTVVAAPSAGVGNGTLTYSAGSSTACSVNSSTGLVTVTRATGTCTIQASISEGDAGVNVAPFQAVATATTPVTITPQTAPLGITAGTQTVVFGGTVTPSNSITSGALVSPDAISGVTYTYQGTGSTNYPASTTPPTAIGTYAVTPSAATFSTGSASDYAITYNPGSLVIQAQTTAITIAASSQTIQVGQSLTPQFSITSGALNGSDNISGVTYTYQGLGSTSYAASTTAPTAAGTYSVTPSNAVFSSGSSASYTITYAPGTLTITAPTPIPTPTPSPTPHSLPSTGSIVGLTGIISTSLICAGLWMLFMQRRAR